MSDTTDFKVIIVGAGLSGIGAAYHLQDKCPGHNYTILEARENMGGTWDLFRYPGIRSDSDMYTLGYAFSPWKDPKAIADGPSILEYIKTTAQEFGIDQKIRYDHKVTTAEWVADEQKWRITVRTKGGAQEVVYTCNFLFLCSGYYRYDQGYLPNFPGVDQYQGQLIHPQQWPEDLDYADKDVVVIGSGATAVTLVPELAKQAKSVTMLQRTPTYIMNLPSEDWLANQLKKILPKGWAHTLARWKNITFGLLFYQASQRWPKTIKGFLQRAARKDLGPDVALKHFDPPYRPWDQRLCLVPDGDLFHTLRDGKAQILTDQIKTFTAEGLELQSGTTLKADLVVTATGLKIQLLGGVKFKVNGKEINLSDLHAYRGVMLSDLPNLGLAIGYTNASWTLKCDLNCQYICRLLNYMEEHHYRICTPRFDASTYDSEPLLDLSAGYVQRALDEMPKQGSGGPWKVHQNYFKDLVSLRFGDLADEALQYD